MLRKSFRSHKLINGQQRCIFNIFKKQEKTSEQHFDSSDNSQAQQDFKELYLKNNIYSFGQTEYIDSRFGFFTRRKLEKQIIYSGGARPYFVDAYNIFINALAQQDTATLKKITEKKLYRSIEDDLLLYKKKNYTLKQVIPSQIKFGCVLIDTRTIHGAYIDRDKNEILTKNFNEEVGINRSYNKKEKTVYKWPKNQIKKDEIVVDKKEPIEDLSRGRIKKKELNQEEQEDKELENLFKNQKPSDGMGAKNNDQISIIQVVLQVRSNMRLCLQHNEEPDKYCLGNNPQTKNQIEYHRIMFERYFKMPHELAEIKQRMMTQSKTNKVLQKQIEEQEMFNPWLITNFDDRIDKNNEHFLRFKINDQ